MIQCIAIVKIKTTNVLCLCSFIVCVIKRKKREKKNVNQIFSHMNPTLLPIGPYVLKTLKIFLKLKN